MEKHYLRKTIIFFLKETTFGTSFFTLQSAFFATGLSARFAILADMSHCWVRPTPDGPMSYVQAYLYTVVVPDNRFWRNLLTVMVFACWFVYRGAPRHGSLNTWGYSIDTHCQWLSVSCSLQCVIDYIMPPVPCAPTNLRHLTGF